MIVYMTGIITFLVGDPYKPSFEAGILGLGTFECIAEVSQLYQLSKFWDRVVSPWQDANVV